MGINQSNGISERTTGRKPFKNVAGMGRNDPAGVDSILRTELETAVIGVVELPEFMRYGEPRTKIIGQLFGWSFKRAWYYWVAEGPESQLNTPRNYTNHMARRSVLMATVDAHIRGSTRRGSQSAYITSIIRRG